MTLVRHTYQLGKFSYLIRVEKTDFPHRNPNRIATEIDIEIRCLNLQ